MRANLPALEKNILKFRALQMVLLLHQVESLRSSVVSSIRATDLLNGTQARLPEGAKRPLEKAFAILVHEDVLTTRESEDLRAIIDLRNKIGHVVHELVADISAPASLRRRDWVYDYFALDRFERYRDKISKGMSSRFILTADFREVTFAGAEATYKEELERLHKRIDRQYRARARALRDQKRP